VTELGTLVNGVFVFLLWHKTSFLSNE